MSDSSKTRSGGVGVLGLLGVVFVTLKLLGISEVATWSWWWVTAPFLGGFALVALIVFGIFVFAVLATLLDTDRRRR